MKLTGEELHIVTPGPRKPRAVRIGRASHPAGEGAMPAKIPVPALHKVPYNGLAKTPPMGWNSWNKFAGRVDDAAVRGMADAMVSSGMKDAGYIYINIDDTWEGERDAQGNITSNKKFPDMKALADYVHSKGLEARHLLVARPQHLRRLRRQLRPRGAGREDLGRLGHRLSEVRLVRRAQHLHRRRNAGGLPEDGRCAAQVAAVRLFTACASTAARTCGSGVRRWAAICGAPPATFATHGIP